MRISTKIVLSTIVFLTARSAPTIAMSWLGKAKNILSSDLLTNSGLTNTEISSGLKEALSLGVSNVVNKLGVQDGFNSDPDIHIPLPGSLAKVKSALALIGMSSMMDDLELKFNRAAELATPKAKELFINSISQMSITDAKEILTGSDDEATKYLRKTMGADLVTSMEPIIRSTMQSSGAAQSYDSVMGKYDNIPFMPDIKANINEYVSNKAMDGIFHYVAKEEANIRDNPAARTTELLQKVFSQ